MKLDAKGWTEILPPWIQVTALIVAGLFTVYEYRSSKKEVRIERTSRYLMRFAPSEVSIARTALSDREVDLNAQQSHIIAATQGESRAQRTVSYYNAVIEHLAESDSKNDLRKSLETVLDFLQDGAVCAEIGQCDRETLRKQNGETGPATFRAYAPYICSQRDKWSDPRLWKVAEEFYNAASATDTCDAYKKALGEVEKMKVPKPN